MESLGYVQSHMLVDIRLVLGYAAAIIVGGAALYEWKFGFQAAKGMSTFAVGAYTLLNVLLYAWSHYMEKNIVYVGKKGNITVRPSFLLIF